MEKFYLVRLRGDAWCQDYYFSKSKSLLKTEHVWENFSVSSQKLWTLDFSFSSQNRGTACKISRSLLENGEIVFTFSFSSWSLRIENPFLFHLSKVENILLYFPFSSRNWGKEFPVSLFSLETGEKNFKFLFLVSIEIFGLSSMTGKGAVLIWTLIQR